MRKRGKFLPSRITPDQPDFGSITAAVIGAGGIAAIPTETSYGLAIDPFNQDALRRLFELKRRPLTKPLLVLIDDRSVLSRLASAVPDKYLPLMKQFWPGPLTLIFPALAVLPELLTAGSGTVGVRVSSNHIATEVCRCAGGTITATSANISGQRSARSVEEIIASFKDRVDIVVDGGELEASPGSTIIGCRRDKLISIREGAIPFTAIQHTVS